MRELVRSLILKKEKTFARQYNVEFKSSHSSFSQNKGR